MAGTEADEAWRALPDTARVVVVERDGVIVGCHILIPILHAECLWKAPDAGAGVSRLLWETVQAEARDHFGAQSLVTAAVDARVKRLLAHVGARAVPGESFVVPVKG